MCTMCLTQHKVLIFQKFLDFSSKNVHKIMLHRTQRKKKTYMSIKTKTGQSVNKFRGI